MHLVQCWYQQGTTEGVRVFSSTFVPVYSNRFQDLLQPSQDMCPGTSKGTMALNTYYHRTDAFARLVNLCCKVFYPKYHLQYEQAFAAGKTNLFDPGPFLGRVLVWGLPVGNHRDGGDTHPTLTSPNGHFKGGPLYLPDLRLKFR